MKISGAIFDLDDTLTYSEHIWEGIPQMFLKRHGKVAEEDIDRKIINLNTAQIGEYFKEHYFQDSKRTAKSIVTEFGIMGAPYYLFKVPLMPGTKKLVKQLYKQGVTMTILTANERHLVRAALRRLGILKYFDSIRCGSDPENAKSNPKSFENALAALGTPKEETFVFEDSLYAIETATAAGFKCIAMQSAKHSPETVARFHELCEYVVTDYTELLDILEGPKA